MEKVKYYYNTFFPVSVIQESVNLYLAKIGGDNKVLDCRFSVQIRNEEWSFDSIEEFYSEYPDSDSCDLRFSSFAPYFRLQISVYLGKKTMITVAAPNRKEIEAIFQIFENNVDISKITAEKDPIKIFIGHGNDQQWRLLKDHLRDYHGFDVVTYEIGPRAGRGVKEVLEDMLNMSSIAFLILTGEDIVNYNEIYARQNVVHELGLFQGKIGFKRAIAILEDGVTEFSNINGVNQIRFSKGNIRETFGDVVATIKREFEG